MSDAGRDTSICQGGSVVIGGTIAGSGAMPLQYNWTPAAGLSCVNCPNPTANPSSDENYTLTVTDNNGCTASSSIDITLFTPSPASFTFTGNNNCANIPVNFTNTTAGNGLSFSWDFGDPSSGQNNFSSQENPSHVFQWTGTGIQNFTVTLQVTSPGGCTRTVQQTVSITGSPGPALIDPEDNFRNCDGSNFNLTVYDATAIPNQLLYTIVWGDGSANYTSTTAPSGGVSHLYTTPAVFELMYIVRATNGCVDTVRYNVSNITNPAIGAANPGGSTGCGPLTLCFPLSSYSSNHSTTQYIVNFGDGTPFDTLMHPPPSSVCHTYDSTSCGSPGNFFSFSIRAMNSCDESEATIAPIRVFIAPIPDFETDTGCVNQPLTFRNNTVTGFNSSCSGSAVFNWDFGDGSTLTTTNPGNVTHTYTTAGRYTVKLTATNNCANDEAEQEICIEDTPIPDFSANQTEGCVPFTTSLTNLSSIGVSCNTSTLWTVMFNGSPCLPSAGQFQFVGGTSETSLNPQIEFLDQGEYSVSLAMTNSCGVFEKVLDFKAQSFPQPSLSAFTDICAGDSIEPVSTNLDCLAPISSFDWVFAGGTPNASNNEIPGFVSYPNAGNFSVQLSLTNVCGTSTITSSLRVNPTPPILNPEVMSPLCENDTAYFTSDLATGAVYNWTGPGGFTNGNQNFDIKLLKPSDAGWYYLYGTLGLCQGPMDSIELQINQAPPLTATSNVYTICYGDTVTLSVIGATSYTWSPSDSLSSTTGSSVFAFPSTTTNFIVFGSDGVCTGIDTVQIVVNSLPVIDVGPDTTICNQPIAVQFNASPSGGVWSGQNIDASGSFTPNGAGNFQITYTVIDENTCIDSAERIVNVIEVIDAIAGPDTNACFNDNAIQLTGSPANGFWTGIRVSSSGLFTPDTMGVFTLTYAVGSGSCYTEDSLEFNVKSLPNVVAGNDTVVCIDEPPFQLIGIPNNGLWSGTGVANTNGQYNPQLAGQGDHVVSISFTEATTGCAAKDSLNVRVNPLPLVNAGPDTTVCNQPISVQLSGLPVGGSWTGPNVNANGEFIPNGTGTFKLYYAYTAGTNCFNLDSMLITVSDPVPSDAGVDLEICMNEPDFQLSGSPANGVWDGSYVTPQGVFSPIQAGTFSISISNGVGNCLTSDTMLFVVHDLPTVDAGMDQTFCWNDEAVQFNATPVSGEWSGAGITDINAGNFVPNVAGNGSHFIQYSYIDPTTNCQNNDTLIALVNALPISDFDYDSITCIGEIETYSNLSTNTSSSTWFFGDGSTSNQTSPNHSYTSSGFYSIQLIAESGQGCLDTIAKTIEVRVPPVVDFTLSPDSACAPVEVAFTNNSSGIEVDFLWQFGNGNTSTVRNPANEFYQQGFKNDSLYKIYLSVSNICGVRTDSATVRAMPKPVAIFAPENDVTCDQFPLAFVNNSYGFPDTFDWDFGNGNFSTSSDSTFTHSFDGNPNTDTTHTIRLIVSNECGKDTAFHTIRIYPSKVNAFFNTNVREGCAPLTVQFSNFSQGQSFSSWDFGDGNVSNSYNVTHTFTNPGQYEVRLFANNNCDYDTTSIIITVNPDPLMDFAFSPDSVCPNETFRFTNLSTFANSYQWKFGDGDSSSLTHPSHAFQSTGWYDVTLKGFSTQYQCSTSVTKKVRVKQGPAADFELNPPFGCAPLSVQFNNRSLRAQFIQWDFGNGNTGNGQTSNQVYDSLGIYLITLIAHNGNGCKDTVHKTVSVYESPKVNFTSSISNQCVTPFVAQFNNQSTGAINYNWSFGDGQTSSSTNTSHAYPGKGPYTVTLIGENLQGCRDTLSGFVQAYTPAQGSMAVNTDTACSNVPIIFTASNQFTDSILWVFGNGMVSSQNPFVHTFEEGGVYDVQLISYGQGGCNDTVNNSGKPIVIIDPIADFDYIDKQIDGVSNGTVSFINLSEFADKFQWDFGNGKTSTDINPITNYTKVGDYEITLIAYADQGCSDTVRKVIGVNPYYGLFIPNALNPENINYELRNFSPKGVGMAEFELWIFDDWGNKIWYTNVLDSDGRPVESWNGKHM
ncbi:MAG: PKD domain-containing protein, partial [Bacteroidetes bacterium]|nr:PKD domain-containing protein [Bacteroidota bacterium]